MTRPKPWRDQPPATIVLAGVAIPRDQVNWIADQLGDDDRTGDRLRTALTNETRLLGLHPHERESILRAIEDPPPGLEQLRGELLAENVRWRREGLT